jgi:hypothetical protein
VDLAPPLDLPVSEPVFQPVVEAAGNAVPETIGIETTAVADQAEAPAAAVVEVPVASATETVEVETGTAAVTTSETVDNQAPAQPAEFVIPASVLVGMDDSFIAPARPSSLAASVAEAVHAAALESALESAAASSQPAVVTAAVTETPAAAPVVPAATERRRAPNDPRNRLPPQ